jgi:hypothetical protein
MVVDRYVENAEAYFGRGVWKHKVAATAAKSADIAQLVEQVIRNDQVVGSNPTIGFLRGSRRRKSRPKSGAPRISAEMFFPVR